MTATPFIIGITGGSASGKSAFLSQLKNALKDKSFTAVSQDNYYRNRELQPLDSNGISNFDTPYSIDTEAFIHDVKSISGGKSFTRKEYTYNNPLAQPRTIEYHPASLIILEGLFLLNNPDLRAMMDFSVYIEAEEHLKLKRRILRDQKERGYDLEDVLYRYENHVFPCYENHIRPFRKYASIVVPNNHDFSKALEMVKMYLENKLKV